MSKVKVFKNYKDYIKNKKPGENGVSAELATELSADLTKAGITKALDYRLENCTDCWNCYRCIDCSHCFSCMKCFRCKNCMNCIECFLSKKLITCRDMLNSFNCNDCVDCECLENSNNFIANKENSNVAT